MTPGRDRYRLALTPGGAGTLTLFFPGLLVALASAQRPLAALSIGAALVLAANAVWARTVLGRLTIGVEGPVSATVGEAVSLEVRLEGPQGMEGAVALDGGLRPWVPTRVPGTGRLLWRARQRGVVDRVTVRVQTSIPLGLTSVIRISSVPVSSGERGSPIHVVPAPVPALVPPVPSRIGSGALVGPTSGPGDPIGLRQYRIGDTIRDVHWATVARTRTLMVRDRPDPAGEATTVVVISVDPRMVDPRMVDPRMVDPRMVDDVLGRGREVLHHLLNAGHRVELRTHEGAAPVGSGHPHRRWVGRRPRHRDHDRSPGPVHLVTGPVRSRDDVARRLARVVPEPPGHGGSTTGTAALPLAASADVPVLVVDGSGQRWQ